jgi:hypothetical protein
MRGFRSGAWHILRTEDGGLAGFGLGSESRCRGRHEREGSGEGSRD